MARTYQSEVRKKRAGQTREALLQACEKLLLDRSFEEVTLPAVAQEAGVSKPTAYSHFPDNAALLAGFLGYLRGRIGMDHETLTSIPPANLHEAAQANFQRFDRNGRLLRRLMDSPDFERVRLAQKIDRAGLVLPSWAGVAPESVLRKRLGPVYLFVTPSSWRWLRETWGLSSEDAAEAAAWAMQTLIAAISKTKTQRSVAKKSNRNRTIRRKETTK